MTRLKIYINNTDSLSEEINADSVGKGDLRSTYEKALLLLDQRESNIVKKKKRNDETEVIDRSIKVIINLISMSIGKPSKKFNLFLYVLILIHISFEYNQKNGN